MTSLFNLPITPFTFNPEFNFAVGPYAPMGRRPPSHFRIQLSAIFLTGHRIESKNSSLIKIRDRGINEL